METYLRIGILILAAIIFGLFLYIDNLFRKKRNATKYSSQSSVSKNEPQIVPSQLSFSTDTKINSAIDVLEEDDIPPVPPSYQITEKWARKEPNAVGQETLKTETAQRTLNYTPPAFLKKESKPIPQPREKTQVQQLPSDLLVVSVVAKQGTKFASYDLLQAIFATGMQFGDKKLFHYSNDTNEGKVKLFSLAAATTEGSFDLDHIGDYSCPGLILFMDLSRVRDPEYSFKLMFSCAQQLVDDLEGELRADPRTPWSDAIMQQYMHRITESQSQLTERV